MRGHAMRVSAMLHALLKLPRRADSASDGIRYPGVTDFDASHCLARGVLRLPRGGIARFLVATTSSRLLLPCYHKIPFRRCFELSCLLGASSGRGLSSHYSVW